MPTLYTKSALKKIRKDELINMFIDKEIRWKWHLIRMDDGIEQLTAENKELKEENEKLKEENEKLKEQLDM